MKKMFRIVGQNFRLLLTKIYYRIKRRDKNLWVFGEWLGEKCCDNCLYFANYISYKYPTIKCIWISKEGTNLSLLNNNIERVVMDTPLATQSLKKAGVVFFTHGIEDLTFSYNHYFSGALAVDFWHGVPWKKIHADMYSNILKRAYWKYQTKMFSGNIYLSTSPGFTSIIESAFGCNKGSIIECGYPRNVMFYNEQEIQKSRSKFMSYLKTIIPSLDSETKIVVYMPTFRDKLTTDEVDEMIRDNKHIRQVLEKNNAIIIKKGHFVSQHNEKEGFSSSTRFIKIPDYPSQELLASADVLITDYSSCYFDYLLLDRPVIHYLYDYEYYSKNDRGLYYNKEDVVGGEVAVDLSQLARAIESNLQNPEIEHELRQKRAHKFMTFENSDSCEIIFEEIRRKQGC